MTQVTNGVRPGDADRLDEEPVVLENPFAQEQRQQQLAVAVGSGALAALVAYVLWRLKLRRTPPTATERVTDAAKSVVDAAAPAGERLVDATKHLGGASLSAGERALEKVGDVASPVVEGVADAAHGVHKFWRKWTLRILIALAGGVGYTAGAAAGRERYEQIVGAARSVSERVG